MKYLAVILSVALLGAGCAAPGSALATLDLEGVVVDEEGAPLPGTRLDVLLSARHGLRGLDARGDPAKYGHRHQLRPVVADGEGRFRVAFDPFTYSLAFWILPPLGFAFQGPPWPIVGFRVEEADEVLWVRFTEEGAEARRFRLSEPAPLEGDGAFRATGTAEAGDIPRAEQGTLEGHRVRLRLERTGPR